MTGREQTIVLITDGIGKVGCETANILLLSSADNFVIIGARDPLQGEQVLSTLKHIPGRKGRVSGVIIKLEDVESIARSAEEVGLAYGRIDVLINCADDRREDQDAVMALHRALNTSVVGATAACEYYKHLLRRSQRPRIAFLGTCVDSVSNDALTAGEKFAARVSARALDEAISNITYDYNQQGRGLETLEILRAETGVAVAGFLGRAN